MTGIEKTLNPQNPLAALAAAIPAGVASLASVGGRLLAAAAALFIATDQSYDPSQVFTVVVAALFVVSLVPFGDRLSLFVAGIGCGLAFFAGAILAGQAAGFVMLASGALAGVGQGIVAHRRDGLAGGLLGFFIGAGLSAAMVVVTILTIDG